MLGGWLSDRTGRRKPFVFGSAALAAIGLAWVGMAGDVTSFLVAVTVSGFGKGLLFVIAACFVLLGAAAIHLVKGVR
ncbi:hypothetical protein E1267_12270 [Nonomuraea longispora]|uniref:Major facilitator superfamily (MFS) profile domain-containing protein n=1 Tax=Nonomuraea longispora TaxID=1848320 RepID=A0A4R4NF83_9ACTN|nr:hypothetical protein [Nonomuraea longispora]TDC07858.1 hypothetical protein E1267_12270 [Nonomuraea longispora]